LLTIRDISAQRNLIKEKQQNSLLNLLTSNFSHELMTPIRCIISLGQELFETLYQDHAKYKAELILNTSKLLLTQV